MTSQKHRDFVSEPMGYKEVTELAGIGHEYGRRLKAAGFDKASKVLGQFLILNSHKKSKSENKESFILWLRGICGANDRDASRCYECLLEWSEENM